MTGALRWISSLAMTAALGTGAVSAHHSISEYDTKKVLNATGTVEKVDWVNPHAYVTVVTQEAGADIKWRLEFGTPGVNLRMGWKKDTLKVGDKLAITFSPLRDGRTGGMLLTATFPDGRTVHTPSYYLTKQGADAPQGTTP